jgi:hypothetical protein
MAMTAEAESPFGEVTLSAAIPGIGGGSIQVAVKAGVNPFIAAKTFKTRMVETFGAEAIEATITPTPPAPASTAAAGPPKCNVHNRQMKPSKQPGAWFCSAKLGDGSYCTEKVEAS